jgi:hypothetical protein
MPILFWDRPPWQGRSPAEHRLIKGHWEFVAKVRSDTDQIIDQFELTYRFPHQQQAVQSELFLFAFGSWFIKNMASYLKGQQARAMPLIKAFMEQLSWPEADKS